jgi:hypothetical protein
MSKQTSLYPINSFSKVVKCSSRLFKLQLHYLIEQLENLADERIVLQFKRNPYYQYFRGYPNYLPDIP